MVYFCQMIGVFFGLYNPFPPRPKTPFTHVVYLYNDVQLSKGHLGSRGEASKNKLKDTSFIFSMTNITILSTFHMHAQKEYCKVLETKGIYILNNIYSNNKVMSACTLKSKVTTTKACVVIVRNHLSTFKHH